MNRTRRIVLATFATALASAAPAAEPPHPRDGDVLHGEEQALPARALGDLDAMRERRLLRVLVPYSRSTFFFDKGVPRGFVHDVFREYERFVNAGVAPAQRIRVVFVPVPRDRLIPRLLEGHGDVAAGRLTITPRRTALVDFSAPIRSNVSEIVVTPRGAPAPRVPEDLSGRTVHVRRSSSYYTSLLALNARLKAQGRPPVTVRLVDEFLEDVDVLEKVEAGLMEATLLDDDAIPPMAQAFPQLEFHTGVRLRQGARFAWAFRKDSPRLKASLDRFIADAKRGPGLLNQLERRYFVENRWLRRTPRQGDFERFEHLRELFVESAGEFGLEWVALLSQGYQESGLKPQARSAVGAVGIMQLMPATAAAPPILLPDVHRTEVNVRAGAKYMRFLMDHYFADAELAPAERFRFALAAYNAGPNRIRRLREVATRAGLDPNVWYDNVEIVVARHVGQEPVTYVANIEKYYFAFRRSLEIERARHPGVSR